MTLWPWDINLILSIISTVASVACFVCILWTHKHSKEETQMKRIENNRDESASKLNLITAVVNLIALLVGLLLKLLDK